MNSKKNSCRGNHMRKYGKWYFDTIIVMTLGEKNCSSFREKLLKFEVEGRGSVFRTLFLIFARKFESVETSPEFARLL